ncbi:MAG: alpha-hydroxy-acid oxidizing protein [Planctomycetaceae bacterium]
MPIMLALVAGLRMYHHDEALAVARAAHVAGTLQGVSSSAYHSIEEIAEATPGRSGTSST